MWWVTNQSENTIQLLASSCKFKWHRHRLGKKKNVPPFVQTSVNSEVSWTSMATQRNNLQLPSTRCCGCWRFWRRDCQGNSAKMPQIMVTQRRWEVGIFCGYCMRFFSQENMFQYFVIWHFDAFWPWTLLVHYLRISITHTHTYTHAHTLYIYSIYIYT